MPTGIKTDPSIIIKVCQLKDLEVPNTKVAEILDLKGSSVDIISTIHHAVRTGTPLKEYYWRSQNVLKTVCELYNVPIESVKHEVADKQLTVTETAQCTAETENQPKSAGTLMLQKLLEAALEQNELLVQFMDTVMPKYLNELIAIGNGIKKSADKVAAIEELRENYESIQNCMTALLELLRKQSGSQTEQFIFNALAQRGFSQGVVSQAVDSLMNQKKIYISAVGNGASKVTRIVLK